MIIIGGKMLPRNLVAVQLKAIKLARSHVLVDPTPRRRVEVSAHNHGNLGSLTVLLFQLRESIGQNLKLGKLDVTSA
jgi:hypothetical protein